MIEEAKKLALYLLRAAGCNDTASESQINEAIHKTLKIYNIDETELKRHVESEYKIWVDDYRIIEKDEGRRPWLAGKKSNIKWDFWNRYKWYLEEKRSFHQPLFNQ